MKDSGVEWIGEIPEGWDVVPMKSCSTILRGGSPRPIQEFLTDDIGYNWIKISDAQEGSKYIDSTNQKIIEKGLNHTRLVTPGTLLLTNSMSFGKPYILNINGCIHDGWLAFTNLKNIDKHFLYYYLLSPSTYVQFSTVTDGSVVQNLNINKVTNSYVVLPPLDEQQKIVSYLDERCSKLDAVIEKQRVSVEELKAYKLAVITEAVTKGLNPDVEMKDSGVEWIGVIPHNWSVRKLKYLTTRIGDGLHGTPEYDDNGKYYFINGNNLGLKNISLKTATRTVNQEEYNKYKVELTDSTLLISLNGTIGNLSYYNSEPIILSKSAGYISLKYEINIDYVYYYLQNTLIKTMFELSMAGTTIKNLSLETLRSSIILSPPLPEQQKIADYLDKKCQEIDVLISQKQRLIEKLTAYKKSLIYEVVTGKKEV